MLSHTKFSSVVRQAEGKFWRAIENCVKVLILQEGILVQSIKGGKIEILKEKMNKKTASK
jgi:hypothetical protein